MSRFLLLLLALAATPALAQTGTLEGTVRDAAASPLPGATVLVADTPLATTTDADGRFRLADVPAGTRTVEVRFVGYATARRIVAVEAGQTVALDVALGEAGVGLDQVVVTADRRAQPLRDVPAAISVVSARDLDRRASTTSADALVGVPGVSVRGDEANDVVTVTLRGVPNRHGNDTFVALVDGVPFLTGNDEVDLGLIVPPAVVDRVEVVRGSASALYGRGGIAGAINFITVDPFGQPPVQASLLTGSYGLLQPSASVTVPVGETSRVLVAGLYEHRDGWRERTGRDAGNLFAKGQFGLGASNALSVWTGYNDTRQNVAQGVPLLADGAVVPVSGGLAANYNIEGSRDAQRLWQATARLESQLAPGVSLTTTAHARALDYTFRGGFTEPYVPETGALYQNGFFGDNQSTTQFAESQLRARLSPRVSVVAGLSAERIGGQSTEDWTGEYGFNPDTFEFLFYIQKRDLATGTFTNRDAWVTDRIADIDFDATVGAAYAQTDLVLVPERLTLGVGGRFDTFQRTARFAETISGGEVTPAGASEDAASAFSPKASLSFRATPSVTAYVVAGRGFSPAFGPVWAFRARETTLAPERATNAEVGIKGGLFGDRLAFALAAYRLDRRDLLLLVPTEGASPIPRNAGRQLSQGVEAEARADLGALVPGLAAWGSYTFTDAVWKDYSFAAEFGDTVYDFSGRRVAGAPRHLGTAGLAQRWSSLGLDVSAWLDAASDYDVDNGNTVSAGGYALVNASVAAAPRALRGAEVRLTLLNAFDQQTFAFFGGNDGPTSAYPGRPREVALSLRYAL